MQIASVAHTDTIHTHTRMHACMHAHTPCVWFSAVEVMLLIALRNVSLICTDENTILIKEQ